MPRVRKPSQEPLIAVETVPEQSERPRPPEFTADGLPNAKVLSVWDYMQALSSEQWKTHIWYLYRTKPALSFMQGQAKYLAKGTEPFTMDDVMEKYGGLQFRLDLNRVTPNKRQQNIYTERFAIEAPPKLQSGEKLDDAKTPEVLPPAKDESAVLELAREIIRDVKQQRDDAQREGKQFDGKQALSQALELHTLAFRKALESISVVSQNSQPQTPLSSVKDVLAVVRELRNLNPEPGSGFGISNIRDILGLVKELKDLGLKDLFGGGESSGPADWKMMLANMLGQKADTIFTEIRKTVEAVRDTTAYRASVPVQRPPAPAPSAQPAAASPAAAPRPGPAIVQPLPIDPLPEEPAGVEASAAPANADQLIDWSNMQKKQLVNTYIVNAFLQGVNGKAVAAQSEKLDPEYTDWLVMTLDSNPSALASEPAFLKILADPRLEEFVKSFLSHFEEESDAETSTSAD